MLHLRLKIAFKAVLPPEKGQTPYLKTIIINTFLLQNNLTFCIFDLKNYVLEFFFHAPTVLINSIIHNKSMVPTFKLNIEFSLS